MRAEQLGFGGFFRSDHFHKMGKGSGLVGPTDAWVTLGCLARETTTIRLGTLVSPVTFRAPGLLAVTVAQVDQMSGGRVELGIGAGWYEKEHRAYGFPFPSRRERFDSLADQLAIITGLWDTPVGETFTYEGIVHSVDTCPALPKPAQRRVPIIMGGTGRHRTPQLAARYATEFNTTFQSIDDFHEQKTRIRLASEIVGRTLPMVHSATITVCAGSSRAQARRRAERIGRDLAELAQNGAAGSAEQVAHSIRAWADAGAQRMYLEVLDLDDHEHLELIATEVVPMLS